MRPCHNEISAFLRYTGESAGFLSLPYEDTGRRWPPTSQEEDSHQEQSRLAPQSWTFKPLELRLEKIKFCCLSHPVTVMVPWHPELTRHGPRA